MLSLTELRVAMRPVHGMYGPVVQQRNMIDALRACGIAPPADPGGGVSAYNDVLVSAIRAELHRRETYFQEA